MVVLEMVLVVQIPCPLPNSGIRVLDLGNGCSAHDAFTRSERSEVADRIGHPTTWEAKPIEEKRIAGTF
jgi:hypothetical protein